MSKKKGKQMKNLPYSYINAMEELQIENDRLREELNKLKKIKLDYDRKESRL